MPFCNSVYIHSQAPLWHCTIATMTAPVVKPNSFLTLHYRLAGSRGDVVNTFGGAPATLQMGSQSLADALQQQLLGLSEGSQHTFEMEAGSVFGHSNPAMQQWLKRGELVELGDPEAYYAVGEVLQLAAPDGQQHAAATVLAIKEDAILLDFNHPLAGEAVTFEVQIVVIL